MWQFLLTSIIELKWKHMPMNLKKKYIATKKIRKREKDIDDLQKIQRKKIISCTDSSKPPFSLGFLFLLIKVTLSLCA